MKRQDYLDWDTTLMGIAQLISFRSKDPNTRHGVVIVDQKNRIISVGYNGFARGVSDDIFPWTSPEKYDFVVHAEHNAIMNSGTKDLENYKLYLWSEKGYPPCSNCAKTIIQSGIKEIILSFMTQDLSTPSFNWKPTLQMFKSAEVKITTLNKPFESLIKIREEFSKISQLVLHTKKGEL